LHPYTSVRLGKAKLHRRKRRKNVKIVCKNLI
jgi:hypothetical protein